MPSMIARKARLPLGCGWALQERRMTPFQMNMQKYHALMGAGQALIAEAQALRKRISVGCKHPPECIRRFSWEHDTGYGVQSKCYGDECSICLARNHYGSWSKPNV